MKKNLTAWLSVLVSLLFALGVVSVFRACARPEDGEWMNCHNVQRYLMLIALCLAAAELISLALASSRAIAAAEILRIAGAALAMALPGGLMHMCMMDTMRCHALMKPFAYVMGVLVIALALVRIAQAGKKTQKNGQNEVNRSK